MQWRADTEDTQVIIGSDDDLLPVSRQTIIYADDV